MKKRMSKLLAWVLATGMLVCSVPMTGLAAEATESEEPSGVSETFVAVADGTDYESLTEAVEAAQNSVGGGYRQAGQ